MAKGLFGSIGEFFFGKKKKDTTQQALQIAQQAPRTQRAFKEGKLVSKTLQERLAGRGVGFRPEIISGMRGPIAAQPRAAFREQILPTISAQASARGLGRATIPISIAAREQAGVERGIAERIAQLELASEQQRRAEINAALTGLQRFGEFETGTGRAATQLQLQGLLGAQGLAQQQQQQQFANLLGLGTLGISGATLGAKVAGVGGFAPSPLFGTPTTAGARVNIEGLGQVSQEELEFLRGILRK